MTTCRPCTLTSSAIRGRFRFRTHVMHGSSVSSDTDVHMVWLQLIRPLQPQIICSDTLRRAAVYGQDEQTASASGRRPVERGRARRQQFQVHQRCFSERLSCLSLRTTDAPIVVRLFGADTGQICAVSLWLWGRGPRALWGRWHGLSTIY